MKQFIFLSALFAFTHLQAADIAAPQDEVARMDILIKVTEINLEKLKAIRALLVTYKQAELNALKNPNDTANLLTLLESAKKLNHLIEDTGVQDYFAPQFLEELKKLAAVSTSKNIPPAK